MVRFFLYKPNLIFFVCQTLKEYERARIEFDAYRTDLEKMQMMSGPNEPPGHQQKLDEAMKSFKLRKEKLDKLKVFFEKYFTLKSFNRIR